MIKYPGISIEIKQREKTWLVRGKSSALKKEAHHV